MGTLAGTLPLIDRGRTREILPGGREVMDRGKIGVGIYVVDSVC